MEILVTAPAIKRQAVSTEILADEARKVPGTQGDVLRVVENLPGVARASMGSGALVVWGAAPGDTGVYIDGVPVPRLYHDGGLRSVMGSDLVESVELVPGGYGAAYGRGLGGLVSVSTRRFDDGTHGGVSADVYDTAASVHGPLGERFSYGVAGRYGYVGPFLSAFYPEVEDYFPVPHYADGQARVGWRLGPNRTLDLTGLLSTDSTTRTAPNPDPAREASEQKTLDFQRVSLRYLHDVGDGSVVSALVFAGADQSALVARYGPVDTALYTDVTLGGVRGSYRARVAAPLTLEGGVDALVQAYDVHESGSVAVPPREGDVRVFGQAPPDQISADAFTVTTLNVAPYAEGDLGLFSDRLHLVAGLRADPNARSISRASPQVGISPTNGLFETDFRVEPRANIRFAPTDRSWVTAAWGEYSQQPAATDLSASFGNPELPASTGTHYVLGGGYKPLDTMSVEATGFYTASEGLAMRNPAEQPLAAEALVASGSGRTYGAQAMARLDPTSGVYAWLSYTLAWSERQDAPGDEWRPSDYDQRHSLTALGGYAFPFGLEVAARVRVATGFPRTSVTSAYYDSRRDLWQPIFGEHNDERLPTFFQADLRVARAFEIAKSTLDLSLEIQNVSNQENVEEYIYSADYSERGTIQGLPILPVLGARWSF
jgi:outer membrane receptor for ferrienterochelin and colicin